MVLAQSDENIKYLNASLVSKLRDYNIEIPSFTIPDILTQQGFRNAMKEVPFNDNGWIENTLNCLNIGTASCRGCVQRQTEYGQCSAGCFGANTCGACVGACNSGDAVCVSCHAATDEQEVYICESCDTGCEGCNADCYGCNEGCQGAQTCTSCNSGLTVPCEYDAGCTDCQGDYEHEAATFGCTECVNACVAPDSCGVGQVPTVDGCTSGDNYTESSGCTSGNSECSLTFPISGGTCKGGFTQSATDEHTLDSATCPSNYRSRCSLGNVAQSCQTNFKTENEGEWTSCASIYENSTSSCVGYYSQTPGATNCVTGYTTTSGVSCQSGYTEGNSGKTCKSRYEGDGGTCQSGYNNSSTGDSSCTQGYSDGTVTCPSGYTSTSGGPTCISDYSDGSTTCVSDYGLPTCSGCNATANDQCLSCVASQDTCTSCVSGEAASCISCVEAQGCSDCQGCDSGCNDNVSCNGYSVGDSGQNVCVGQYNDTTCNQSCIGGFDSSVQCLSGQYSCPSCDSGCQTCDDCQGSDNICPSCYVDCNSCQGGDKAECTTNCVGGLTCDPCWGSIAGCKFGTEASE